MSIKIDELNDVKWREYRKFAQLLRLLTPEGEEFEAMGLDELRAIMIVAAFRSGWVKGVSEEDGESVSIESLDEMHPGNVIQMGEMVMKHYNALRSPDPN